ncbi:DNA utilization protein HofM [Salmonella enterica subsp. enterica]|uniref:DNA utilization protein HofM n=1 Tax=Salmonella enterica I TaxID=59201 RepID=A0A3S4HZ96_SALET|nr:DNA utilization protein HofM [Salmonella enterica subsp. enterica]
MARELDMDPDLLRFDFQDDALSPAFNVTAVQSKEISELLTLAQTLNVRIAAVTPDACALQRLLPFIPSGAAMSGSGAMRASGCGRRAMRGDVNRRERR